MSLLNVFRKKSNKILFTTPSHDKNCCIMHKFYQWYRFDISEIDALSPEDALIQSEQKAATIYKTNYTKFLTNGSTSGILAAVLSCCKSNDKLLIWDKSHKCHFNAGKLASTNIIQYSLHYNADWGIYEPLSADEVDNLLKKYMPKAIIITSPTYEGMVSDIKTIKSICNKYSVRLIVDEAHGALYNFSDKLPQSAVNYADFTVQSLHKTAGGINPTALLHSNCEINPQKSLELISTTSPSYPMLATIEANIKFLNSQKGRNKIDELIFNINQVKSKLTNLEFYGDDITKILIKKDSLTGYQLSEILYNKFNIEDERTNEKSTLLLTGIGTTPAKLNHLLKLRKI